MNSITVQKKVFCSRIVNEDYFALKVVYNTSVESTKYVGFYYGDTDLFEFAIDKETNIVKRFQLVVCKHFEILDMDFPSTEFEEGSISLYLPQHNESSVFDVHVYKNAVKVLLSNEPVQKIIKCDQVFFGLTGNNDLSEVSVVNMSKNDVDHVIEELMSGD